MKVRKLPNKINSELQQMDFGKPSLAVLAFLLFGLEQFSADSRLPNKSGVQSTVLLFEPTEIFVREDFIFTLKKGKGLATLIFKLNLSMERS